MSNMKCPFCQQELECCGASIYDTKKLGCANCGLTGDSKLFEKLADTKKKLDVAVDALKWIDETYKLGQELETDIWAKCQYTLEQINSTDEGEQ